MRAPHFSTLRLPLVLTLGLSSIGAVFTLGTGTALATTESIVETTADPDTPSSSSEWTYQGRWVRSTRYVVGDIVIDRGNSYVALQNNRRSRPMRNNSNEDWGLLAQSGRDGADGAPGPQGDRGQRGRVGAEGPQGPQGARGLPGAQGAQGPAGPTGATGPAGPMGPAGPAGADAIVAWNYATAESYFFPRDGNSVNEDVVTVSITVPEDGFVALSAWGTFNTGTNDGSNVFGLCVLRRDTETMNGDGRSVNMSSSAMRDGFRLPFAIQRNVQVSSGSHVFHLACRTSPSRAMFPNAILNADIRATFLPAPTP